MPVDLHVLSVTARPLSDLHPKQLAVSVLDPAAALQSERV